MIFEFQVKNNDLVAKSEDLLPDDELRLLSALIVSPGQEQQKGFFSVKFQKLKQKDRIY